jgi:hypothetical protein
MKNLAGQRQHRRCHGYVAILATLTILVSASTAFGFDGQRKGFLLGFGLGGGWVRNLSGSPSVVTDLNVGFAISEQLSLYYAGRQIWVDAKSLDDDPRTFVSWIVNHSLGASYYLTAAAPAFFLSCGIGVALVDDMGTEAGWAPYVGAGYEFARHWSVVIEFTRTWINSEAISDTRLYISGTAY